MLPRPLRLRKKEDFFRVIRQGKARSNDFLSVRFQENSGADNRFGVLAPVKNFRQASLRNRLKRKMREVLKYFLPSFLPGRDIILVARPGLAGQATPETLAAAAGLFKEAGLLKEER